MFFRVNSLRTWINPISVNLFSGRRGYVRHNCSSAHDEGIHVEHEIREFPGLVKRDEDTGKIAVITAECDTAKSVRKCVPSSLSFDQVAELMMLPTKSQRKKYLTVLWKTELLKNARARKKLRLAENKKSRVKVETEHIKYGPGFNTLFPFIPTKNGFKKLYKRYAASRMLFSQILVIDLDYDDYMAKWEAKNCAYQFFLINIANMTHSHPFNIYLCNADRSKATMQCLEKSVPGIWDDYLVMCSSSSYVDIFPKEKLVYLSPHAEEVMECYDHDAIYIIGGFVDKRIPKPFSFEKAKREGIRTCRFPLDKYIMWKNGTKSLTLDQVVNILLEMKIHNNWKKALQFVPLKNIKKFVEDSD